MPTIVWLGIGAGVWLGSVMATCVLLTAAKRADECERAWPGVLGGLVAGGLPAENAAGARAPRRSAIVIGGREPRSAAALGADPVGAEAPRPRGAGRPRAQGAGAASAGDYALHVRGEAVGRLQWRSGPQGAVGWYLWRRRRGWSGLGGDEGLQTSFAIAASPARWPQTAELAALVSTSLALDAAADLLGGPLAPPPRPLRAEDYELHVSGLKPALVPIVFPEAIVTRRGDIGVLSGHFDDAALARVTRRIAILGGRALALFAVGRADA